MYCNSCGNPIQNPQAIVCTACGAPVGRQPGQLQQRPEDESPKTKTVILLLWFFLGGLGIHRFYLGHVGLGIAQLLLGWATCFMWPLIDGIYLLATEPKDDQGLIVRKW